MLNLRCCTAERRFAGSTTPLEQRPRPRAWAPTWLLAVAVSTPTAAAELDPFALASQGGLTMLMILLASVLMLAVAVERVVQLRRTRVVPPDLIWQIRTPLQQGELGRAKQQLLQDSSTLARVLSVVLEAPESSRAERHASAGATASRELREHLRKSYPLAVIAGVCPVLGLLGTVVGMIEAFHVIASAGGMGDPAQLAGGISKALVTTAAGLIVALPALALHHWFRYRVQAFAAELETRVSAFINDMPTLQALAADAEGESRRAN